MMRRSCVALVVVGLVLSSVGCRQRSQSVTPVAVPAKVYEGTSMKAPVIQFGVLGEVFKSPLLAGQKEGDVPTWWSIETRNGVGVAHGADFAAVPIPSEVRYTQAQVPLLNAPNAGGQMVRALPAGEKLQVATRPPTGAYVLVVDKGLGVGFVDKAQLDTAR